jgi:hypothetical protein
MIRGILGLLILVVAVGCSGGESKEPGYEAKDFKKSGPPPEYKGPGQPGGPPGSGPISGPK